MVEDLLYLLQEFGSPGESPTAMNECCSLPGQSNNSQYLVPPPDTMGPYHGDFDPTAIDMGQLMNSSFPGTRQTSLEAACAPDADVLVRQPQHLSPNNDYPRSSKRPVRKQRRGNGLKGASSVMGQAGMPNPASRLRKTLTRFTPEDVELLIKLKEKEKLTWEEIAKRLRGHSPNSCKVKYCTERKKRTPKIDEANQRVPPNP